MGDLVQVSGLCVVARDGSAAEEAIVSDVSFSVPRGEVLALIGESGSGKTTIALALMGYARAGCRIAAGSIRIGDTDVLSLGRKRLAALRGCKVTYIAQSVAAAFNPAKTVLDQIIEGPLVHGLMTRAAAEAKALELFRSLALPEPDRIGRRYPHQVSGGQLQRLMAAMALITDPALVILDEPTTALDVTTQIEVLRAFKSVVRERDTTAVYVSHDLAVVAQMADQIVVLHRGEIRETGATEQILAAPQDNYTQTLMAAARPSLRQPSVEVPGHSARQRTGARRQSVLGDKLDDGRGQVVFGDERNDNRRQSVLRGERADSPLLSIQGLVAGYGRTDSSGLPRSLVLNDISLSIRRGGTLGVIGESGSGKSTLARVIAGLVVPARGAVLFDGEPLPARLDARTREQFRRIQIVFQNADTALNPSHTVARILGRPLAFYHGLRGVVCDQRIAKLLDQVRLPVSVAARRCGELSGGQKQRVNLARALAAEPDLILCDEVTSALDTVVGAAILDLLAELRREINVSYLFISHDISTVRAICDEIVVLYSGRKVEAGDRELAPPFHPYTDLLISSVPEMRRGWLEQIPPLGTLPAIGAEASTAGLCAFLKRCPVRIDGVCNLVAPSRQVFQDTKEILCHHGEEQLRRLHQALHGAQGVGS
jgi:peptide/nickel transport system ATP-binding protein